MILDRLSLSRCLLCVLASVGFSSLIACGVESIGEKSELKWNPSRTNNSHFAYLEDRDLKDDYYLGISVTKTKNFDSNALNMVVTPTKVRLELEQDENQDQTLAVKSPGQGLSSEASVLKFKAEAKGGKLEVDFSSSRNDLELSRLVQTVGGMFTTGDENGRWLGHAAPTVEQVTQDQDTVIVDLLYHIRQVNITVDQLGRKKVTPVSQETGDVSVRMWLKRADSMPNFDKYRSVSEGKALNIGFFGPTPLASVSQESDYPIQRLAKVGAHEDEPIVFYLKDFPLEMITVGIQGVQAWNTAFGSEILKADIAPEWMDAGDPRFLVIKWFDQTTSNLPWAGVANMITIPETGAVVGGGIYIQGDTLSKMYEKIHHFSTAANTESETELQGTIGQLKFKMEKGETPVVPFYTDVNMDFFTYMKEYYLGTITHEVGHVLGLRHNFKGSTESDETGFSASVMDYLPRAARADMRQLGFYDIAAIQWGYFGEKPIKNLPFCTDEDVHRMWDCNRGDLGDPVDYVTKGLVATADALANKGVPLTEISILQPMQELVENAIKMWFLRDQMPVETRVRFETQLKGAYQHVQSIQPNIALKPREKKIARQNIMMMTKLMRDTQNKFKQARAAKGKT